MRDFLVMKAIGLAIPVLLGPVTYLCMQGLKRSWEFINGLPSWQKQALVMVMGQGIALLQSWSGQELACGTTCTLADVTPVFVKGVLGSGVALLLHYFKKLPSA